MYYQYCPLYGINQEDLFKLLEISSNEEFDAITKEAYKISFLKEENKIRKLEIPSDNLMLLQRKINKLFQILSCPSYNFFGYKGKNNLQNARQHIGNFVFLTIDIKNYFPSTEEKYIREFYKNKLKIQNDAIESLIKLTSFKGHLPTGAPTSPLLALLVHKNLFDEIYEYLKKQDIKFTLYADDMALSAKKGITGEYIQYISNVLKKHKLTINQAKIKWYSYKKALITGFYIHQSGKITVPDKAGYEVIKILKEKKIVNMDLFEVRRLLGKINYIQLVNKSSFKNTRIKAIKRLKQLQNKIEKE